MPEGAIYVGRKSLWGNDFKVTKDFPADAAVIAFELLCLEMRKSPELFRAWLEPLRGHDLVCWCPVGEGVPCYADVLLRLANE